MPRKEYVSKKRVYAIKYYNQHINDKPNVSASTIIQAYLDIYTVLRSSTFPNITQTAFNEVIEEIRPIDVYDGRTQSLRDICNQVIANFDSNKEQTVYELLS